MFPATTWIALHTNTIWDKRSSGREAVRQTSSCVTDMVTTGIVVQKHCTVHFQYCAVHYASAGTAGQAHNVVVQQQRMGIPMMWRTSEVIPCERLKGTTQCCGAEMAGTRGRRAVVSVHRRRAGHSGSSRACSYLAQSGGPLPGILGVRRYPERGCTNVGQRVPTVQTSSTARWRKILPLPRYYPGKLYTGATRH